MPRQCAAKGNELRVRVLDLLDQSEALYTAAELAHDLKLTVARARAVMAELVQTGEVKEVTLPNGRTVAYYTLLID